VGEKKVWTKAEGLGCKNVGMKGITGVVWDKRANGYKARREKKQTW
jgi:hypothetical protein